MRQSPFNTKIFKDILAKLHNENELKRFVETEPGTHSEEFSSLCRYVRGKFMGGDFMDNYPDEDPRDLSIEIVESVYSKIGEMILEGVDINKYIK